MLQISSSLKSVENILPQVGGGGGGLKRTGVFAVPVRGLYYM